MTRDEALKAATATYDAAHNACKAAYADYESACVVFKTAIDAYDAELARINKEYPQ